MRNLVGAIVFLYLRLALCADEPGNGLGTLPPATATAWPTDTVLPSTITTGDLTASPLQSSDVIVPILPGPEPAINLATKGFGAAQCFQERKSDSPSEAELYNWLLNYTTMACTSGFAGAVPGSKSAMGTYINGFAYVFYAASVVPHEEDVCLAAFQNITEACIVDGNFFGGQITSKGELYNLTNFNYPGTPLVFKLPDMFKKNETFELSAGSGTSVSQDFDHNSFPDMFKKKTQWRFFTQGLTDVKSWSIDFHGSPEADVKVTDNVASFEMPDSLPLKITVTATLLEGLVDTNPNYKTTLVTEETVTVECNGFFYYKPKPVDTGRRPTHAEIQSRCDSAKSQWSLEDGSFWQQVNASGIAGDIAAGYAGFDQTQVRFDQYTSEHSHGPDNWNCGLVESKCSGGLGCEECDTPAGFAILESYAGIHMYYKVLLNTLEAATGDVALVQSAFTSTFTEAENPTDKFLKSLLTVFTGIAGMLNAYVGFASGVAKAGLFDGKLISLGSGAVSAAASAGMTAAKDSLPVAEQLIVNEIQISSGLLKFIIAMKQSMSDYVSNLFQRGSYTSKDGTQHPLRDILQGGFWLASPFKKFDSVDITTDWRKIFYGKMVQIAWKTHTKRRPVIMGPYDNLDSETVYILSFKREPLSQWYKKSMVQYKDKWYVLAAYDSDKGIWHNKGGNNDALNGDEANVEIIVLD